MYDLFIDTEYEDMGGKIFLVGILSSHGEEYALYGTSLRKDIFLKILNNTRRIFVYGPDIGKLEKHFNLNIKGKWKCINVLSIVRKYLPFLESKGLAHVEHLLGLERSTLSFKNNTRDLAIHWKNPKLRFGIINYNMEDVVFLQCVYDILMDYFKFNPDDFRIMPK